MSCRWEVALRTVSESNARGHWSKKASRVKLQRGAIVLAMRSRRQAIPPFPVVVTLTRVAPRQLDDDNLRGALKAVRDQVAVEIGLANDADPRVTWEYAQDKGPSHDYAVRVQIAACGIEILS